jgi:AraC family transcriptional regulator
VRPVDRAIWYIETHSDSGPSLDDIAKHACVSKYYLLRAFSAATGLSIMRYVRARRLSAAARQLATGSQNILAIAVATGYGSHEAFTRAFREQFGVTPEAVRAQRHLNDLQLQEAVAMSNEPLVVEPPRFEAGTVLLIAGLSQRYAGVDAGAGIPAQWQRFASHLGSINGQIGQTTYGVCYNTDDEGGMDYLSGVEVRDFTALPEGFTSVRIPAMKYAVFTHRRHISTIRGTWNAIWNGWLPQSGHEAADAPIIERYDQRFDPRTGNGEVELWVPLQSPVR